MPGVLALAWGIGERVLQRLDLQQTLRQDVDEAHRSASRVKLERLQQQRGDLGSCLDQLLADSLAGKAYFKVYRQFKMYNDARFNPALVAERAAVQVGANN